jgi:hypothetical protein
MGQRRIGRPARPRYLEDCPLRDQELAMRLDPRSPFHNKDEMKRVWCGPNLYCNETIIIRQQAVET